MLICVTLYKRVSLCETFEKAESIENKGFREIVFPYPYNYDFFNAHILLGNVLQISATLRRTTV